MTTQKGYIYRATCKKTEKCYIGQTWNFDKRKQQHLSGKSGCPEFARAIKRHGSAYFTWEILHTCYSQEEMNLKEREEIAAHNCIAPNGYNLTEGGEGDKLSEEAKQETSKTEQSQSTRYEDLNRSLYEAARFGQSEVVKLLIAAGANVHAVNKNGMTALHRAAICGNNEIAKLLIAAGADVNAMNKKGSTALYKTALNFNAGNDYTEVAKLLIAAGANVHAMDIRGTTALHVAAKHGSAEVAKVLISLGANVHAMDIWGKTALRRAAENGHAKIMKVLLDNGAYPDMTIKQRAKYIFYKYFGKK